MKRLMGVKTRQPTFNRGEIENFNPEVVKKKVLITSLSHSGTIFPTALGIGSALAGWILGWPILFLVALLGLVGPGWAVIRLCFLNKRIAASYLRELRIQAEEESERKILSLKARLERFGIKRASEQLEELQNAFAHFKDKLEDKIGSDQPEYEQYLGTAQGMCLAAVNSLSMIVDNAEDAETINEKSSLRRLAELERTKTPEHEEEAVVLRRKLTCLHHSKDDCELLIKEVEEAITTLLEITHSLNEIGHAKDELNQSVRVAMQKFIDTAARNRRIYDKIADSWQKLNLNLEGEKTR